MIYHGRVKNGRVELDDAAALPEGAEVHVEMVSPVDGAETATPVQSLYQRLAPVIGQATNLPADASLRLCGWAAASAGLFGFAYDVAPRLRFVA